MLALYMFRRRLHCVRHCIMAKINLAVVFALHVYLLVVRGWWPQSPSIMIGGGKGMDTDCAGSIFGTHAGAGRPGDLA